MKHDERYMCIEEQKKCLQENWCKDKFTFRDCRSAVLRIFSALAWRSFLMRLSLQISSPSVSRTVQLEKHRVYLFRVHEQQPWRTYSVSSHRGRQWSRKAPFRVNETLHEISYTSAWSILWVRMYVHIVLCTSLLLHDHALQNLPVKRWQWPGR